MSRLQHDERFHQFTDRRIRLADDAGFGHGGMLHQRTLHFKGPHHVSSCLDDVIGATDEVGLRAAVDKTHVHDVHATLLHLLGIDHERLTYRHAGRDYRLTDIAGEVVTGIIA